jgi:hypothetical protein
MRFYEFNIDFVLVQDLFFRDMFVTINFRVRKMLHYVFGVNSEIRLKYFSFKLYCSVLYFIYKCIVVVSYFLLLLTL